MTTDDPFDPDDEALLAELREAAARHDPVPPRVTEAALGALAWRTVDAELAELLSDSHGAVADEALAGVRGEHERRSLSFESASLTVELDVIPGEGRVALIGQLVPGQAAAITLRHPEGSVSAQADELGRFELAAIPPGPVSLRLEPSRGGAPAVETEWLPI